MGGGMEHAAPPSSFGERQRHPPPRLSPWWRTRSPTSGLGDFRHEKDWDDAWLSAGFATYFASLASESMRAANAFLDAMRRSRASVFAMENARPASP